MQNMMKRHQMGLVFELVKLALLALSCYLTYGFLSRFLPDFWFRWLALVLYEGGLVSWHYIHHYKTETARQHMFSRNMERLSLAAVGTAAGYQLLTLVSAGFGDSLPGWTHLGVEVATAVVFMLQLSAFMHWEKLSHYYAAVERAYNQELAGEKTALVTAVMSQVGNVRVVESGASRQNLELQEGTPQADTEAIVNTELTQHGTFQSMISQATDKLRPIRVDQRLLVLEALAEKHPSLTAKEIAAQTGLSQSSVRRWQSQRQNNG